VAGWQMELSWPYVCIHIHLLGSAGVNRTYIQAYEHQSWSAVLWPFNAKESYSGCPQVPRLYGYFFSFNFLQEKELNYVALDGT